MDLDDINPIGILLGMVGLIIAVIISKKMGSPVPMRIITGIVVGVVCYFVGGKITEA